MSDAAHPGHRPPASRIPAKMAASSSPSCEPKRKTGAEASPWRVAGSGQKSILPLPRCASSRPSAPQTSALSGRATRSQAPPPGCRRQSEKDEVGCALLPCRSMSVSLPSACASSAWRPSGATLRQAATQGRCWLALAGRRRLVLPVSPCQHDAGRMLRCWACTGLPAEQELRALHRRQR